MCPAQALDGLFAIFSLVHLVRLHAQKFCNILAQIRLIFDTE
jgi:hypothetical protein